MVVLSDLTKEVVDSCYEVHRLLGPGLLEKVYEKALACEIESRGFRVMRQVPVAATYKGVDLDTAFYADLVVEDAVIIELKSVKNFEPVHFKQLLTYLKLADIQIGFLVNFNCDYLKDNLRQIIN